MNRKYLESLYENLSNAESKLKGLKENPREGFEDKAKMQKANHEHELAIEHFNISVTIYRWAIEFYWQTHNNSSIQA